MTKPRPEWMRLVAYLLVALAFTVGQARAELAMREAARAEDRALVAAEEARMAAELADLEARRRTHALCIVANENRAGIVNFLEILNVEESVVQAAREHFVLLSCPPDPDQILGPEDQSFESPDDDTND